MTKNYWGPIILVLLVMAGGYWLLTREVAKESFTDMLPGAEPLQIESDTVPYYNDYVGYYAHPVSEKEDGTEYPAVVMVHEWWGLNVNIRDMADELASQGYRVFAVDLFGKVATTPAQAQEQVAALDQTDAVNNMRAAAAYLRQRGSTEVAVLGWCFGGGQALQLSLSGEPLAATVIYYGQLNSDAAALAPIDWPVLGIFGDQDQVVTVPQVEAFASALTADNIPNEIYVYPGVGHAFANPSGDNFAPEETKDAWAKTLAFLEANLQP